ncbi:hypothetical protein [Paraburkholderia sp.]|uniref:hypothetical protein n=1 Tax=Paraburkholderia sp. TaxID=1926495 RepID=UPI00239D4FCD|nr:hypothetical protein [Paraburkholderia sp.]MDE1181785.1 hypothetical protein [Paraburkholderia sp.]
MSLNARLESIAGCLINGIVASIKLPAGSFIFFSERIANDAEAAAIRHHSPHLELTARCPGVTAPYRNA